MNDSQKNPIGADKHESAALQERARALLWFFEAIKANPKLPQSLRQQLANIPSHLLRTLEEKE